MKIRDRIKSLRRVLAKDLIPNQRNWREHPDAQRDALRAVLTEIGYADALLARERGDGSLELINGHLRADLTPEEKVPVLIVDVSEEEAATLLATMDPLAAMAEADQDSLRDLLGRVETKAPDLQQLLDGLATDHGIDFDALTQTARPADPGPQVDRAAELQKKWGTKPGQLWTIEGKGGVHRLLCGDASKLENVGRLIRPASAVALVTDPPYAIANQFGKQSTSRGGKRALQFAWDQIGQIAETVAEALHLATGHCKENGACFVFTSIDLVGNLLPVCRAAGFIVKPAAFVKTCPPPAGKGNWWPSGFELAFYGYRPKAYFADEDPKRSNVFHADGYRHGQPGKVDHPTQKPLTLITRIVEALAPSRGLVLDPFLGSGTTMVAAEQLGRVCHGIEIEPKYVAVALERLKGIGLEPRLSTGGGRRKAKAAKKRPTRKAAKEH